MSISNPNLPKSDSGSSRQYTRQMFLHDLLAGITVGLGRAAAGHGIWHRLRRDAAGRPLHGCRRRLSDLGSRRLAHPDRRPHRRFRRHRRRHRRALRHERLAMVTLMAGIILLAMGLTGLGSAVRFIPRPVVIGFTNGIAILIASTQIKDFFGLRTAAVPSEFLPRMKLLRRHIAQLQSGRHSALGTRHAGDPASFCRASPGAFPLPSSLCWPALWHASCSICPSRPSAADSAAFRAGFRPSPSPTFTPSTFCRSSLGLHGGAAGRA